MFSTLRFTQYRGRRLHRRNFCQDMKAMTPIQPRIWNLILLLQSQALDLNYQLNLFVIVVKCNIPLLGTPEVVILLKALERSGRGIKTRRGSGIIQMPLCFLQLGRPYLSSHWRKMQQKLDEEEERVRAAEDEVLEQKEKLANAARKAEKEKKLSKNMSKESSSSKVIVHRPEWHSDGNVFHSS